MPDDTTNPLDPRDATAAKPQPGTHANAGESDADARRGPHSNAATGGDDVGDGMGNHPGDHIGDDAEPFTDAEAVGLLNRIAELEAELTDAKSRALRLMADFNNYQRRALQNEVAAEHQGAAKVVLSVVPVIDHFDHALAHDGANASAQQVLQGVKVIRDELLKALHAHGVRTITPARGEPFVPGRHEALMQQAVEGLAPGTIAQVFQCGFAIETPGGGGAGGTQERVVRPAKVVVVAG